MKPNKDALTWVCDAFKELKVTPPVKDMKFGDEDGWATGHIAAIGPIPHDIQKHYLKAEKTPSLEIKMSKAQPYDVGIALGFDVLPGFRTVVFSVKGDKFRARIRHIEASAYAFFANTFPDCEFFFLKKYEEICVIWHSGKVVGYVAPIGSWNTTESSEHDEALAELYQV